MFCTDIVVVKPSRLFFVLGIRGWLAPQGWQGGIPPVSLVAVVTALVPLLVKRKLEHDKRERAARRREKSG